MHPKAEAIILFTDQQKICFLIPLISSFFMSNVSFNVIYFGLRLLFGQNKQIKVAILISHNFEMLQTNLLNHSYHMCALWNLFWAYS